MATKAAVGEAAVDEAADDTAAVDRRELTQAAELAVMVITGPPI